jgi:hypothetical protein
MVHQAAAERVSLARSNPGFFGALRTGARAVHCIAKGNLI